MYYRDEHKALNIIMYFVSTLLLWCAVAAFYLLALKDMEGGKFFLVLLCIGLVGYTVTMAVMLIRTCTVSSSNKKLNVILFVIAIVLGIACLILSDLYYRGMLTFLPYFGDGYYETAMNQTPYWVFSASGALIFIVFACFIAFSVINRASVISAFLPIIIFALSVVYCVGCYYITGWVVTNWSFEAEKIIDLYYMMPIYIIIIINLVWSVLRLVCMLIVKIGSV